MKGYLFVGLGNLSKLPVKYRIVLQTSSQDSPLVIKNDIPQNADLPKYYSKPIVELRRTARDRLKNSRGQLRRPVPPPKNWTLVKSLTDLWVVWLGGSTKEKGKHLLCFPLEVFGSSLHSSLLLNQVIPKLSIFIPPPLLDFGFRILDFNHSKFLYFTNPKPPPLP